MTPLPNERGRSQLIDIVRNIITKYRLVLVKTLLRVDSLLVFKNIGIKTLSNSQKEVRDGRESETRAGTYGI